MTERPRLKPEELDNLSKLVCETDDVDAVLLRLACRQAAADARFIESLHPQRGVILGDAIFGKTSAEFARAVAENEQMRQEAEENEVELAEWRKCAIRDAGVLDAFEAWLDERWNNDVLTIAVRLTFGSALIELRQRRAQQETR